MFAFPRPKDRCAQALSLFVSDSSVYGSSIEGNDTNEAVAEPRPFEVKLEAAEKSMSRMKTLLNHRRFGSQIALSLLAVAGMLFAASPSVLAQKPEKVTLLVKTAKDLPQAQAQAAIARNGGTWKKSISKLDLHVVEVPAAAAEAITRNLKSDAAVVRVETSRTRKASAAPSDPLFANQWALPKIAWDQAFGTVAPISWTKVAILDTGIEGSHADLAGTLVAGTSIIDDSNGITDPNGHGTWLAGIVAAKTNNVLGMAGVGFDYVQVMPVKVLDANGLGQDADIIAGVVWAADNGASVILMAFSNPGFSQSLQDAIDYAWSRNVVLVAAAGNDGVNTPTFPAGDRGVIGVSGTDQADILVSGSNFGTSVFMGAPAVSILGTAANNGYASGSGTSAAAAIVAGSAALMRAVNPTLTNGVVVSRLARTADAAGTQEQTGNGRVQLARALADTSTESIQPVGTAPLGGGGPFVGPYKAAARNWDLPFAGTGSGSVILTPDTGTINAPVSCGGTGTNAASQTVTSLCAPKITTSVNGAIITFTATANVGSLFAGWSLPSLISPTTCTGTTNPCTGPFTGNGSLTVTFTANVATTTSTITAPSITYGANGIVTVNVSATTTPTGNVSLSVNSGTAVSKALTSGSATFTSVDILALGSPNAGSLSLSATYAVQGSFGASSGGGTLTVGKATPAVTATGNTCAYTAAACSGSGSATGVLAGPDVLTPVTLSYVGTGATVYPASATAPVNAGTYTVTASFAGNANYFGATSVPASVTISKATPTATLAVNNSPQTYDGSGKAATITLSASSVPGAVTGILTGGAATQTPAGTYAVTANFVPTDTSNYNTLTALSAGNFVIDKAAQAALTVTAPSPVTFGTPGTAAASGGTTGGAVSFSAGASTGCTVSGTSVTVTNTTLSCSLTATMAGNDNYNAVTSGAFPVSMQKANQAALTLTGSSALTFAGATGLATAAGGSGTGAYVYSDAGSTACTVHASTGVITVTSGTGTCSITATRAADANYLVSASSSALTVTINKAATSTVVTGGPFEYNALPRPATVVVTRPGALPLTPTPTYAGSCSSAPITFAQGTSCTASYTYPESDNYLSSTHSASITITPKAAYVTPDAKAKYFGQADPLLTGSPTGFIAADLVTATYSRVAGEAVGTYTIAATLAPAGVLGNYAVTYNTAIFTINQRPTTITLTGAASVMYGSCGTYNYSATLWDVLANLPITGQPVSITIGTQTVTGTTDGTGTFSNLLTINQIHGSISGTAVYLDAASPTLAGSASTSLPISIGANLNAGPVAGASVYTGPMLFWTANTTSSTATVTLSATLQNAASCPGGDIRTAKVTFATRNGDGSYTPIPSAQNLGVGLVSPTDPSVGSASAIVQMNIGNQQVQTMNIAVIVGGNYSRNVPADDTLIMIAIPGQANSMVGTGEVDLKTTPLSSGFLGQQLGIPAGPDGYLQIAANVAYSVKGNNPQNPQGGVTMMFNSYNKPDGTVDTILHTYYIKSTAIASLTKPSPTVLSFTSKGNLQDVTNPAAPISVDGGATLLVTSDSAATTGYPRGRISVSLQPKTGGTWIVSGWSGTQPVIKPLVTGLIAGN